MLQLILLAVCATMLFSHGVGLFWSIIGGGILSWILGYLVLGVFALVFARN